MQEGEKIGVVGINGTGKSTLLRILAGDEEPDSGEVILASHIVIRYLPQNPDFPGGRGVLETILQSAAQGADEWEIEGEAKSILTELGFTDYEQKVEKLSGGQKKRLALAKLLAVPADILILDEPTNHLDPEMASWLEEWLRSFRGSLLMITHDRYFLDSVCNRILEIDHGNLYSYMENYEGFLALKAEREEMAAAGERKRQSILRTELAWMQRGARARSTKQKAHIQRFEKLRDQKVQLPDGKVELSSVASRLGRTTLEVEGISKAFAGRTLFRDFSYIFLKQDRVGFVGTNGCGKTTLLRILAGELEPDCGTVITGQTVKIGYYAQELTAQGASLQERMDPDQRVIDYIRDTAEYVRTDEGLVSASKMLERFLFTSDMQYSPLGKLSGGERRRLNLLRILMSAPNVLILDEPTNDLDITTMTILEDFLDRYEGIVIAVSHDRYFLDRTMKRIFSFEDGQLCQYEGGYTDYRFRRDEKEAAAAEKSVVKEKTQNASSGKSCPDDSAFAGRNQRNDTSHAGRNHRDDPTSSGKDGQGENAAAAEGDVYAGRQPRKKLKFTWKEQHDYETIEQDIAQLEETIVTLEQQMNEFASDFVKLEELSSKAEEAKALLEEKMERWLYLEELAAKIAGQ